MRCFTIFLCTYLFNKNISEYAQILVTSCSFMIFTLIIYYLFITKGVEKWSGVMQADEQNLARISYQIQASRTRFSFNGERSNIPQSRQKLWCSR